MATQLASAAINVPRDSHYQLNATSGLYERTLLLEAASQNQLPWSADFSNAAWVKTTTTVTTGVRDPLGGTAACTLTATGASAQAVQNLSASGSIIRANSLWIRRRTGSGTIRLYATNSTITTVAVTASWQRFTVLTPSASTARLIGVIITTSGDAIDVYNGQMEDLPVATTDIVTGAVGVTRSADSHTVPFPFAPCEMTLYARFYERGTLASAMGLLSIGNSAAAPAILYVRESGGKYSASHANGVGSVAVVHAAAPAVGDVVELRVVLGADGSLLSGQTINGAAEVLTSTSAALALATAWSDTKLWLNNLGTTTNAGFAAFTAVKVQRGVQTLVTMRAA